MSEEKTYGATERGFINFLTKHSQLAYIMTIVLLVILLFTYINYSLSHIQIQRSDLSALITIDTADGKDISKHILEEDFPATIQEPVVVSTFTWDDQDWNITVTPREHQRAVETAYFIRFILGLIIILIICWFTIKLLQQVLNLKKRAKTLLDKEREYRSLSDNSPDVIIRYDKDLRHTYISPALKTYTGLDTEQLIGKTLEEITPLYTEAGLELAEWETAIKEVMDKGKDKAWIQQLARESGTIYLHVYMILEYVEETNTYSVLTTMRNFTEQKIAENELLLSEERFRNLAEKIPNFAVYGFDQEHKIIFWNEASVQLYGYKKDKALGSKIEDLIIPPDQKQSYVDELNNCLQNDKKINSGETTRVNNKGKEVKVFSDYLKVVNRNEQTECYSIDFDLSRIVKDTGEIDHALLLKIFDNIDEMIFVSDLKTEDILFTNKFTQEKLTGNDIDNKCYQSLRAKKDPCAFNNKKKEQLPEGKSIHWEHYDPEADCYYLITNKIIDWDEHKKAKLTIIMDVTATKKTEILFQSEKDRIYSILESFGEGIIAADTEGKITLMNKAAEELTGWNIKDAEGTDVDKVLVLIDEKTGKKSGAKISEIVETDKVTGIKDNPVILSQDGTKRVIYANGSPIQNDAGVIVGDVILFHDITNKKRKEQELIKSQKLESLGTLAAGIAYDFNNLLSTLFGYIEMAMVFHNSKEKVAQYLSRALGIYERATSLTDKLITFSRRGLPEKKTVDVKDILDETAQFALSGSKIRYSLEIPDDLWLCDADKMQIQQVFNNILINSMQAMPDGGVITIRGENTPCSSAPEWTGKTANYVKITIIDEGTGIPESYLERIFDPFFTTKQQGSGLGLATAYSIIDKHQGSIDVTSVPGEGTTVVIYLPASQSVIHDFESEEEIVEKCDSKIMIMDDDPIIVDTIKDALEELGYTIMICSNGSKALLIFEEEYLKGEPFDLVIFDLTVPGELGGLETLQILREKYPDILALATSGYLDNPVMSDPQKFGFCTKIEKPYHIEDFINTVHTALNDKK